MSRPCLVMMLALAACDDGPPSFGDPLDDPQLPARGTADLMTWLEAGHYLGWHCEPDRHPARPGSGHGANRICSNDALVASLGEGPFPVGAAAVKEVFNSAGGIRLYAVYRKVRDGAGGASWYWYEGLDDDVIANGEDDGTCTGCHGRAPRDFVYTIVR
jgi:hypothetical protein